MKVGQKVRIKTEATVVNDDGSTARVQFSQQSGIEDGSRWARFTPDELELVSEPTLKWRVEALDYVVKREDVLALLKEFGVEDAK